MTIHKAVSVIIPTLGEAKRFSLLKRAIQSIRASSTQPIQIIAVVNGNRFDAEVCDWLKAQPDVQFEYVEKPSSPNAILRGRELVRTEYFSALDDDDEYLRGSTDIKLAKLLSDPQADLVVGNYYQNNLAGDTLRYPCLEKVPNNPLEFLMEFNWLHNNNALFRTSSVDMGFFMEYHPYAEWTFLAFKLALSGKKVTVVDTPVARCYEDTPGSLSKSSAYFQAYLPLFQRMLEMSPPKHIVRRIQHKISAAHHDASVAALINNDLPLAFYHHLQSLKTLSGLKFLSYSRHIISAALKKLGFGQR